MTHDLATMLDAGYVEQCPACGGLSAYAWIDVDAPAGIAHIGAPSCWEWQCGHCRTYWAAAGSPLTAECYTHQSD